MKEQNELPIKSDSKLTRRDFLGIALYGGVIAGIAGFGIYKANYPSEKEIKEMNKPLEEKKKDWRYWSTIRFNR